MVLGLAGAFGAALCYGVGSVLQALAARRTSASESLDPRLLLRLLQSWRYLLGVGFDTLGFVLSIAAVRSLPLFVVQAIIASFLAVTAILGALVLHMPLTRRDWIGLGVVIVGLVLVGLSAAEDRTVTATRADQWGVLVATMLLAALAFPLGRVAGVAGAAALGTVAGLAFGATSVAARMLPGSLAPDAILHYVGPFLRTPVTYALVIAAVVAMLTYSTALQRGTVTQATAPLVVGETLAPALVGVLMLGDRPREGWTGVAVLGFLLAVGGAVSLAGHGEIATESAAPGLEVKERR